MTIWDLGAPIVIVAVVLGVIFVPFVRGALLVAIGSRGRDGM